MSGLDAASSAAVTPSPQSASGLSHSTSASASRAGTPCGWPLSSGRTKSGACVPPAEQHGTAAAPDMAAADGAACAARDATEHEGVEGQPHDRGCSSARDTGDVEGAVGAVIVDEAEPSTAPWPPRLHECLQVRVGLTLWHRPSCHRGVLPAGIMPCTYRVAITAGQGTCVFAQAASAALHAVADAQRAPSVAMGVAVPACTVLWGCPADATLTASRGCAGRAHRRLPAGARHRGPRPRPHCRVRHSRRLRLRAQRCGRSSAAVAAAAARRLRVRARAPGPPAVHVMCSRVRVQPRPRVLAGLRHHRRGVRAARRLHHSDERVGERAGCWCAVHCER